MPIFIDVFCLMKIIVYSVQSWKFIEREVKKYFLRMNAALMNSGYMKYIFRMLAELHIL